jgi:small subunit ribosomal protein S6
MSIQFTLDSKRRNIVKEYELTVLIHPDLEADLETPLTKVRDIIKNAGGNIIREDNWGKKKLAYAINREDFAVYVYMDVELPADAPLKISNTYNITDEVLRYLLVKVDVKARAALAEQAQRAESRKDEDTSEAN